MMRRRLLLLLPLAVALAAVVLSGCHPSPGTAGQGRPSRAGALALPPGSLPEEVVTTYADGMRGSNNTRQDDPFFTLAATELAADYQHARGIDVGRPPEDLSAMPADTEPGWRAFRDAVSPAERAALHARILLNADGTGTYTTGQTPTAALPWATVPLRQAVTVPVRWSTAYDSGPPRRGYRYAVLALTMDLSAADWAALSLHLPFSYWAKTPGSAAPAKPSDTGNRVTRLASGGVRLEVWTGWNREVTHDEWWAHRWNKGGEWMPTQPSRLWTDGDFVRETPP